MNKRQQEILAWLQREGALDMETLVQRLGVSLMTVHRDLDALVSAGYVQKYHGGAAPVAAAAATTEPVCRMCQMAASPRTSIRINTPSEEPFFACCPHCGLLLLEQVTEAASVLARDFLYQRAVNAFTASYVVQSSVTLCCEPGVLCFASMDDAERFSSGFGGRAMSFEAASDWLKQHHAHHS